MLQLTAACVNLSLEHLSDLARFRMPQPRRNASSMSHTIEWNPPVMSGSGVVSSQQLITMKSTICSYSEDVLFALKERVRSGAVDSCAQLSKG